MVILIIIFMSVIVITLVIKYLVWAIIVKQDLMFMTKEKFREKHPLVYRSLLKQNKTI